MSIQLSVVIPIFNEEDSLWPMAEGMAVHLNKYVGEKRWQYVLVDNGSKDSTPQIVQRICSEWPLACPLRFSRPDYGDALCAGLLAATAEWAYIVNVDFWDPIFLAWSWSKRHRYDLILGSKRCDPSLNKQGRYRRTLSWGLNTLLQFVFGFVGTDTHGQKFLKLSTMRSIIEQCVMRRGQFDTEFTLRAMRQGLWLSEVPVPIVEGRKQRNWMIKKVAQNLLDIFRLRKIMRSVPRNHSIRYHRWAREDMQRAAEDLDS